MLITPDVFVRCHSRWLLGCFSIFLIVGESQAITLTPTNFEGTTRASVTSPIGSDEVEHIVPRQNVPVFRLSEVNFTQMSPPVTIISSSAGLANDSTGLQIAGTARPFIPATPGIYTAEAQVLGKQDGKFILLSSTLAPGTEVTIDMQISVSGGMGFQFHNDFGPPGGAGGNTIYRVGPVVGHLDKAPIFFPAFPYGFISAASMTTPGTLSLSIDRDVNGQPISTLTGVPSVSTSGVSPTPTISIAADTFTIPVKAYIGQRFSLGVGASFTGSAGTTTTDPNTMTGGETSYDITASPATLLPLPGNVTLQADPHQEQYYFLGANDAPLGIIRAAGGSELLDPGMFTELFPGDAVGTNAQGTADVYFEDGSKLTVAEESQFALSSVSTLEVGLTQITHVLGNILHEVKSLLPSKFFVLDACHGIGSFGTCRSDAVAAVRGTTFATNISVANGIVTETFTVTEGIVDVTFLDGSMVTLTAGENHTLVVPELPGDFDFDGEVDGADFLKWQRGESPFPLSTADLTEWEMNYGSVAPLSAASAAVPEPTTGIMLMLGMAAMLMARRTAASKTGR